MRIDHVVIPCFDAGKTLAFYGGVLGLPLIHAHEGDDWGGHPWLMMVFAVPGGGELVLVALRGAVKVDSGLPADARHYALSVETLDILDGWRTTLSNAGVDVWEETHGAQRSIYFPDPDGTILEITAPPTPVPGLPDPGARETVRRWISGTG